MTFPTYPQKRKIVFLSRSLTGESLRHARAVAKLDDVCLLGICEQLPNDDGKQVFADLVRLDDAHDPDQIINAARALARHHGGLDRIVTTHEALLEPAAKAGEVLGLQGLSASTVRRVLDKSCLKAILAKAGIGVARDRLVTSDEDARRFAAQVGFPLVLKPVGGSGGLATWSIRNAAEIELALELMQPSSQTAVLAEEYLDGEELCIDTITIASQPQFSSICCYRPSILQALEDPLIQWSCIMPREIQEGRYHEFIEQGLEAVRALDVGNAMTHMEGFILKGGGIRFTDATLRPAGARIAPMLAFAYDMDPYRAWARVALDGSFDGPWIRRYSVGTAFLRGVGHGVVEQVHGLQTIKRQAGELVVDGRLPKVGVAGSTTYTGDGFITIRHPDTSVVQDMLDRIANTVQISYTNPEPKAPIGRGKKDQWKERLKYFDNQLNKPVWDDDSLPSIGKPRCLGADSDAILARSEVPVNSEPKKEETNL
jgi:hypothetical protein